MAQSKTIDDQSIGRFDQSFLIHMIKDFFVILVIVSILEFALKAALVYYDFEVNGEADATMAAGEIAENVRSIMLNEGGPVAARTLYPILQKNWTERGYDIAIVPSEATRESIREIFDYDPEGIPRAEAQDEGRMALAGVEIRAEEFCLSCHIGAEQGDVLGVVEVRSELSAQFAAWWREVQLGLGLALGKIVLHSVLLFLLLRSRLEPLLRLRAVVSNLARAFGGLDQRADIRSADEFGALARDLNLFLNRVERLVGELDQVLRNVVRVNDDILTLQGDLRTRVDEVVKGARGLERRALLGAKREPRLSNDWFEAVRGAVQALDARLSDVPEDERARAGDLLETMRAVVTHAEAQIASNEALYEDLVTLGEQTEGFQHAMEQMIRLEERMNVIVETGGILVRRLRANATPEAPETGDTETG